MTQFKRFLYVFLFTFSVSLPLPAGADQTSTASPPRFSAAPRVRAYDAAARARFDRAEADTQAALDDLLATAVTSYYDNEYAESYRAFQAFPEDFLTAELLYFYADAALKTSDYDTAVRTCRRLLNLDARLHRVRLDLALAHFNQGEEAAARRALEGIDREGLPPRLQERLAQLESALRRPRDGKRDVDLYLSQYVQWDSNINVLPGDDEIISPEGRVFRFTGSSGKQEGWRSETLARIRARYAPGLDNGLRWEAEGLLYNVDHFDSGAYDSLLWRVTAGPSWTNGRLSASLPLTYGMRLLDDSRLYDLYGATPELTCSWNRRFRINGTFSYLHKAYAEGGDGRDKQIRGYEIEPIFYYNKAWDYVGLSLAWVENRAESSRFSNDTFRISASTSRRFGRGYRAYLRYTHRFRRDEDPHPGWTGDREDDEDSLYVSLVKQFSNPFFVGVNLYWGHAESNTDIFDYERVICGAGVGFRF